MAKSKEILRHPYIRVGRLKMNIAKAAHLKSADIYVSENYIKHIENKHHVELTKIGFTAFDFVTHICDKYNQIREGSDDSYLLVLYNEKLPYVASISLNYSLKNGFWEIKTAEPRRCSTIQKRALIWTAAKHTVSGNGDRLN